MNIALFGGSFDPPHADHLRLLKWLLKDSPTKFDEIWIVPVVNHAFSKEMASYEHRAKMVQDLVNIVKPPSLWGKKDTIKIVRREEKYTVETLEALHVEQPNDNFYLVVGSDILNDTDQWERWDDIINLASIIPLARKGVKVSGWEPHEIDSHGFSSTQIREQFAKGDLTHMKNGLILSYTFHYIIEKGLYGYKEEPIPDPKKELVASCVRMSEIKSIAKPGQIFSMTGLYSKVVRVEPSTAGVVRIIQIEDSDKEEEHRQQLQNWRDDVTRRWLSSLEKGKKVVDLLQEPKPQGAAMFYLSFGDTVEELPSQYTHIGTVGDTEFFTVPAGLGGGGLFRGLFGL